MTFKQIAAIVALVALSSLGLRGANAPHSRRGGHLDDSLRAAMDAGDTRSQRVIIRVRHDSAASIRDGLSAHGDRILVDHPSIDALTAVVHGQDLATLAANDDILSVSSDAIVRPHGLLGGLLGLVGNVLKVTTGILLPNGADTAGPPVAPASLRQTLGVDNTTWSGRGVGVAVIDSGLEMSSEFQNRVTAFYDFTNGRLRRHIAVRRLRPRHARRRHDRRLGRALVEQQLPRPGAEGQVRHPEGAGRDRRRLHERRHSRHRLRGGQQVGARHRHHQSVARTPILEPAATDPLVQAVERASRAGVVVVAAAGNYGKNPDTGLPGYGGITSPGNAPSAITVGAVDDQRHGDARRRSDSGLQLVRVRPGTTHSSSLTSSPRATTSSPSAAKQGTSTRRIRS